MRPGSIVYETEDGGGLLARVVATLDMTDQVLVRLAPEISRCCRSMKTDEMRRRGYIVFKRCSLTLVSA